MEVLSVAKYTFKEVFRSKVLMNAVFLAVALFVATFVAAEFSYGVPSRVALDFGLGALTLSSVGVAIFIGANLLYQEIEGRTVYMVLSRFPSRTKFLVGKFLGLALFLLINVALLSAATLSMYFLFDGVFSAFIFFTVLSIYFESLIVLSIVLLLSLLTNITMTVIYALCVYVSGHALTNTLTTSFVEKREGLRMLIEGYGLIFPNLTKINFKPFVLYEHLVSAKIMWSASLYSCIYIVAVLSMSAIIFSKKDLN